jgi:hypothetical protein
MRIKITAQGPFESVHGLARSTQIGYWIRILSQENASSHSSEWGIGVILATKLERIVWLSALYPTPGQALQDWILGFELTTFRRNEAVNLAAKLLENGAVTMVEGWSDWPQDDGEWIPDRDNPSFGECMFPQASRIRV